MLNIEIHQNAGLGSGLIILFSHLFDVPAGEPVSIFVQSDLYVPHDENLFARYFEVLPPDPNGETILDKPIDGVRHPFNTQLGYSKERIAAYRQLRDRYFVAKPPLPQAARAFIRAAGAGQVLGIHYRGTDKYIEVPRVPREDVLAKYHQITDYCPIVRTFLATDEQSSADWFKERIPNLFMHNHIRTDDPRGLHITQGSVQQADETMMDIYCLAACDMLLVGRGNVSDLACIFSNTMDFFYAGA